jgi:NADH:ubiquinone oxidoreductase subunit 6 (subunit J)
MHPLIKFIFTILGAGLVGFGLGIMVHKNGVLSAAHFEVATVCSLVTGGFFLAMGIPGKKVQQDAAIVDEHGHPAAQN